MSDYASDFIAYFEGHRDYYVEQVFDVLEAVKNAKEGIYKKVESKSYYVDNSVTEGIFQKHLRGERAIGISPINEDNEAIFGVIDIDMYNVPEKIVKLIDVLYEYAIPLVPCRTKSGGLHLYLFLRSFTSAERVKQSLENVVRIFAIDKLFTDSSGNCHTEVFPLQTTVSSKKKGHTITVPYFNALGTPPVPVSYMIGKALKPVSIAYFFDYVKSKLCTIESLEEALNKLPFSDAPPCIQSIYLSEILGESSGRNNFLYSAAIYYKKKLGIEDFGTYVLELNKELPVPLEESDVQNTIKSVASKEGFYKCRDIPLKTFCNKKVCKSREFGLGLEKGGRFSGADFGNLTRVKCEDPYYIWEVRFDTTKEFQKLTFKDAGELLNQRAFVTKCIDLLNQAPFIVKENDWHTVVNQALLHVKEEKVAISADTTEGAKIKRAFVKYITTALAPTHAPYLILMGRVVYTDGVYYFQHEFFQEFLEVKGFKFSHSLLREALISFGCNEDTFTFVRNKTGIEQEVKCWKFTEDAEIKETATLMKEVIEEDAASIFKQAKEESAGGVKEQTTAMRAEDLLDDSEEPLF